MQEAKILDGFPGVSAVTNLPAMQETWVRSLGQEDPLVRRTATHSSILAMDRGAWQATVHGVKESDVAEHTCASSPQIKKAFFP